MNEWSLEPVRHFEYLEKKPIQIQSIIIRYAPQKHSQNVVKPDQKIWNASSYFLFKNVFYVLEFCVEIRWLNQRGDEEAGIGSF